MPEFFTDLARSTDATGFWLAVAIAAGAGALLLHQGLKAFWQLRLIRDTPTASLRSAAQGYVELIGQARPLRALVPARLTGIPCCWYRWRIEQQRRSGRSSKWVVVERGECTSPFMLDDGTGQCVVDPRGATLRCRLIERWQSSVRGGGRAETSSLSELLGLGGRYRMTEERIGEADPVYLLGHLETPRRGVRERDALQRALLKRWKRDPQRRASLDLNGDGEIDLGEWERARTLAAELAERAERRVADAPALARIGATRDARQPFLISTEGEDALVGQSRWQALGGTLAGAMLSAAALAALVARYGAGG
jgi:hypothetical protein